MINKSKRPKTIQQKLSNILNSSSVGDRFHEEDLMAQCYNLPEGTEFDYFKKRSFAVIRSTVSKSLNIKTELKNGYLKILSKDEKN